MKGRSRGGRSGRGRSGAARGQSSLGSPFGVGVPLSRMTRSQRSSRPPPAQRGPYSSLVRFAPRRLQGVRLVADAEVELEARRRPRGRARSRPGSRTTRSRRSGRPAASAAPATRSRSRTARASGHHLATSAMPYALRDRRADHEDAACARAALRELDRDSASCRCRAPPRAGSRRPRGRRRPALDTGGTSAAPGSARLSGGVRAPLPFTRAWPLTGWRRPASALEVAVQLGPEAGGAALAARLDQVGAQLGVRRGRHVAEGGLARAGPSAGGSIWASAARICSPRRCARISKARCRSLRSLSCATISWFASMVALLGPRSGRRSGADQGCPARTIRAGCSRLLVELLGFASGCFGSKCRRT